MLDDGRALLRSSSLRIAMPYSAERSGAQLQDRLGTNLDRALRHGVFPIENVIILLTYDGGGEQDRRHGQVA